jgi:hypothetical protein
MPQPFYVNPPFADIATTSRDNRSAEHESLLTKAKPEKPDRKERPATYKGRGKYPIMKSKRPKNW